MPHRNNDNPLLMERIRECCHREEAVIAAYLFGSAVTGSLREGSDIDVGILVGGEYEEDFNSLALAVALERSCGRPVDLVVLNRAGELLKYQVRRYGCLVFERDARTRKQFEVTGRKLFEDFLYLHRRYTRTALHKERITG